MIGGPWLIHPVLMAAFPSIYLYGRNMFDTTLRVVVAPIAVSVAGAVVVLAVLVKATGDGHAAGLITTALLMLVFAFSRHEARLARLGFRGSPGVRKAVTLLMQAVLLLAVSAAVLTVPRGWLPGLTTGLNVVAGTLCGLQLASIAAARLQHQGPSIELPHYSLEPFPGHRPDIYYIVLDGFARADVLDELYGVDGESFLQALEERGFYAARRASSNYGQTVLSLASSLNGVYLGDVADPASCNRAPLVRMIRRNAMAESLRAIGYRFVTFATGYDLTDIRDSDLHLRPSGSLGEFASYLLHTTPLPLLAPIWRRDPYTDHRGRILYTLERLPDVAAMPGPKFTFAHLLAPHPPFVFGEHGEDVSPRHRRFDIGDGDDFRRIAGGTEETAKEYIQGYRRQATYIGERILRTIDGILENSPTPPVIILQADHGPGLGLDTTDPGRTDASERMGILNAYHMPGVPGDCFREDLSPVNTLRLLFNAYFGTDLPTLGDRAFLSSYTRPFDFREVAPGPCPATPRHRLGERDPETSRN